MSLFRALALVVAVIGVLHTDFPAMANALENPPYSTDGLLLIEGAEALMQGAEASGVVAGNGGIELASGVLAGSLTLAPICTDFPFNEAIPSWNGWAPKNGGFRVWLRASGNGVLVPWFEAGTWGRVADEAKTREHVFPAGKYDIDTLMLNSPATHLHVRIDLVRAEASVPSPKVRLFSVSYTNTTGDKRLHREKGDSRPQISTTAAKLEAPETLPVPFHHQVIENKKWIGRICAPASVNMGLSHFGIKLSTQDLAAQLYDPPSDAFGVWNRSIQGAAQNGVRGYVTRIRNFDALREHIRKGHVICASIRFKLGELKDPPRQYKTRGTEGHLVVIVGLAPEGKVIVNNSGTKDHGHREIWRMDDLAHAWFDKGGVAYVFTGKDR